jgi:hypothetical protein
MKSQKTHWFLLIDGSGSMGSGFSVGKNSAEFEDIKNYNRKIDGAKDQAAKLVSTIRSGDTVTLIAFSDIAITLTMDPISDKNAAVSAMSAIEPSGGTNVDAAFHLVLDRAKELDLKISYRYVNVILISDGLSNQGDPVTAAHDIADEDFRISTILIDPTEDGQNLAKEISIGGRVHLVGSTKNIEDACHVEQKWHDKRVKSDRSALTFITLIASATALLSAISGGIAYKILDNLLIGVSIFGAVAMILIALYLPFRYFAIEEYLGLYKNANSTEREIKKRFIYSRTKRICAICISAILILVASMIFLYSALQIKKATHNISTSQILIK